MNGNAKTCQAKSPNLGNVDQIVERFFIVIEEIEKFLQEQATTEWLDINTIGIDMTYQRRLSSEKVRQIAANFNQNAVGVLIISERVGGLRVNMDGQHRQEAMKKRGIMLAECKVVRGLTVEQEAAIYVSCNTVRKNPSALDTFRARIVTGDIVATTVNRVVEECGLVIDFELGPAHGRRRSIKSIWAVNALEDIYKRGKGGKTGEKLLKDVLTLVDRSWPEETEAKKAYVLLGVANFHMKYQGQFSREEFIAKMQVTDFRSLAKGAQYHAESGGGSIHTAFTKALQEAYDKGKKSRRLEPKQ